MSIVTCVAPVNIAVIKYWGKRDEKLVLPINDSISASLDVAQLCAKTTVMASPDFETDRIWLNGREESMSNERLTNCLKEIRSRAQLTPEMKRWKVHICSKNNFPTAAGLASSAAGYACLSVALAKLYKYEPKINWCPTGHSTCPMAYQDLELQGKLAEGPDNSDFVRNVTLHLHKYNKNSLQ